MEQQTSKDDLFIGGLKLVNQFLAWERTAEQTIRVKNYYIDVCDDLIAGILLSQIVYWFKPDEDQLPKLRVKRGDIYWLAKKREDWEKECRIKPRQFDRAIGILKEKKLVKTGLYRFAGSPTIHIALDFRELTKQLMELPNINLYITNP